MENKINFSPPSTREGKGVRFLLTTFSILLCSLQAVAQSLPRVAPEQVGMDSHRLLHADEAIHRAINHKEIPGAVLAVIRHGKMAYLKAYGNKRIYPNVEPMEINTVFDMASCSKSMSTAVSVMILVERGQLRLLDRVSFYLPDFQEWRGRKRGEEGYSYHRPYDTYFRSPSLCTGIRTAGEIWFSQPQRTDGVYFHLQT